jgi:hypothetical protein
MALGPAGLAVVLITASLPCSGHAEDLPVSNPNEQQAPVDPIADYFLHWYDRVDAAYASQPHWMTPITTVTPRLEEEYRYDQSQQFLQNGAEINNYFAGKGLELIPTETNEIQFNVPGSEQRLQEGRSNVKPATGFVDGNFVTVKQRLLSAIGEMRIARRRRLDGLAHLREVILDVRFARINRPYLVQNS